MLVQLNDPQIQYCGRIDWADAGKPEFIFPATSMQFCFFGSKAKLTVSNRHVCWDNYVGAIVDGVQKTWKLQEEGKTELVLVDEERERRHKVLFFKRMDCAHEMKLESLELSEGGYLVKPLPVPERKIEVYGDSVSAGEVSEALDYVGKEDPVHNGEYSNSWYSYAWILARKLHAQLHDVAQGGIPLLRGTGWVAPPDYPGMEDMWDKLHYHPQLSRVENWDFSRYTPHLVLVAIGQNDNHPQDYMKEDPQGARARRWKETYKQFVGQIREKYPRAVILLMTTILEHDKNWDAAIDEVCGSLGDERIRHFLFTRNGCGTSGHIRITEAEEMADELADYIQALPFDVWEES